MIKTIYLTGILSLAGAGIIFSLCTIQYVKSTKATEKNYNYSIVERFRQAGNNKGNRDKQIISPLVKQAQAFAMYLNPPEPPKPKEEKRLQKAVEKKPVIIVKPEAPKPKFKVIATSYYRSNPVESMALVEEPGSGIRWIKQGEHLGHFFVEKIKHGILVCQSGDDIFEMAVNTDTPEQMSKPVKTMLASERKSRPRLPRVQEPETKKRKPLFRLGLGRPETRPAVCEGEKIGSG